MCRADGLAIRIDNDPDIDPIPGRVAWGAALDVSAAPGASGFMISALLDRLKIG